VPAVPHIGVPDGMGRSCVGSIGSDPNRSRHEHREQGAQRQRDGRGASTIERGPSKVTRTPLTRPEMGFCRRCAPLRCQVWMPRALLSRSESPELGLQRPPYGEYQVRNSHGRIEPEAAWVSLHTAHVDTDIRPVGVWDIDRDARTRVEDPSNCAADLRSGRYLETTSSACLGARTRTVSRISFEGEERRTVCLVEF
jgi:hypothetical protein